MELKKKINLAWREQLSKERLKHALIKGITDFIEEILKKLEKNILEH